MECVYIYIYTHIFIGRERESERERERVGSRPQRRQQLSARGLGFRVEAPKFRVLGLRVLGLVV